MFIVRNVLGLSVFAQIYNQMSFIVSNPSTQSVFLVLLYFLVLCDVL
jgi:hypothetical protein